MTPKGKRRSRPPRPPLEEKELIAYEWGRGLWHYDQGAVAGWFYTRMCPDQGMRARELQAWDDLGADRWWACAWKGLSDAATEEA